MAKRKKKTENDRILALEVYDSIFKTEPDFAEQVKVAIEDFKKFGAKWDENIVYCPNDVVLLELKKWRMGDPNARYFGKFRNATGSLLSAIAAWDLSKVIYRFDADFFSELKETEGLEKVPIDALMHLPYRCVCLQIVNESRLVYLNYDFQAKVYELRIEVFKFNDKENRLEGDHCFLILSSEKLQKCIDDTIRSGLDNYKTLGLAELSKGFEEQYRHKREIFQSTIQMILFIQSQNADIVENQENKEARKKYNRTGAKKLLKVMDSGYRVGAEIRRIKEITVHKDVAEGANETHRQGIDAATSASVSKKTPHVRRAHWHHFWIGSEKAGNRELVVRWLPPMAIGNRSEGLAAVVHDVRTE